MRLPVMGMVVAVLVLLLLAGCSGPGKDNADEATGTTDDPGAGAGAGVVEPPQTAVSARIDAVGVFPVNPAFDPSTLSLESGALVTLDFANTDANPLIQHDLVIEGITSFDALGSQQLATQEFTAPAPGTYVYYCSIGNHRAMGMEGTLTVTAPSAS